MPNSSKQCCTGADRISALSQLEVSHQISSAWQLRNGLSTSKLHRTAAGASMRARWASAQATAGKLPTVDITSSPLLHRPDAP